MSYIYKSVEWASAASDNAIKFNRPNGCWVIEISGPSVSPLAIMGFDDKGEATRKCDKIAAMQWVGNH